MSISIENIRALVKPTAVHKNVYIDQAIFDLEMERIFSRAWIFVAHESHLKNIGDFVRARIGTEEYLVTRNNDGGVSVVQNRCTHRGATVVHEWRGNTRRFVCRYHQWMFQLDGKLRGVPNRETYPESFSFESTQHALKAAPRVAVYRGFVFASLSDEGPSLEDYLGSMREAIDNLIDRSPEGEIELISNPIRIEYNANWKMHNENANDTIHPGVVHNSSVSAARQTREAASSSFDSGQTHEMLIGNNFTKKEWESIELIALPGGHSYMGGIYRNGLLARQSDDPVRDRYEQLMIDAYGMEQAREILDLDRFNNVIYPSLNINAQYHQLRTVHPISPNRTQINLYCFKLAGAPDEIYHRAIRFLTNMGSPASMIFGDDAAIYERCDLGLEHSGNDAWIDIQRGLGFDRDLPNGGVIGASTEAPVRSQFKTWLNYMTNET